MGDALGTRRDQRRDDLLVRVAADPQGLRGLTRDSRARRAGEVAAEHHERRLRIPSP